MNLQNIQTLINWGLRVHPCKVTRTHNGKKKTQFIQGKSLTYKWKWILESKQLSAESLLAYTDKGFGLAAILTNNIGVIDCDDKASYQFIIQLLDEQQIPAVYEKSLSHTSDNMKGHFYFKSEVPLPYCQSLKLFAVPGHGELLGHNHLVLLNIKGWDTSPSCFNALPALPRQFQVSQKQQTTRSTPGCTEKLKEHDGRNNIFASYAGLTRKHGFTHKAIIDVLRAINPVICEDPLTDKELILIADSVCKYPATNKSNRFTPYYQFKEKLQGLRQERGSIYD